jgi:hypothetical protein
VLSVVETNEERERARYSIYMLVSRSATSRHPLIRPVGMYVQVDGKWVGFTDPSPQP